VGVTARLWKINHPEQCMLNDWSVKYQEDLMNTLWGRNWWWGVNLLVDCVWNVMAHTQKPDFVFRHNGWVHLNWRGRKFSWLLASEVCISAVVMLDTPYFEVVWRVLAMHSTIFPSSASLCSITFQLDSTYIQLSLHPIHQAVNLILSVLQKFWPMVHKCY
jgi:hypothetical protein